MSKAQPPKVPSSMPPTEERTIRLVGPIDEDMYLRFSEELSALEADYSLQPVHIELNSPGGEAASGMAIADRLRCSSVPVHITVYGNASSAATVILAAGDYRSMSPSSFFMVHNSTASFKRLDCDGLRARADQMEREEQQWADLLAELSDTPSEVWRKLSKAETHLDARQCLQLGICDNILKGKKRANSLR